MASKILFILVVFLANVMQAITGFAGTLLAMPMSIHLIGITDAKIILNVVPLVGCIALLISLRHEVNKKELVKILSMMFVGMFIGAILYKLCPTKILLFVYGLLIIVIAVRKLIGAKQLNVGTAMQYVILLCAGLIHGMFISGGALLVVYATIKLKGKNEFRATLSAVWIVLNSLIMMGHISQGLYTKERLVLTLLCIIPVLLSTKIGSWLSKIISQELFLKITYVLLLISGILAIV